VGALYRVRQGLDSLWAKVAPGDLDLVRRLLSQEELWLFLRMDIADQRHSLRVMHTIWSAGIDDAVLTKAALLHDVGKSRCHISIVHRTLAVLVTAAIGILPPLSSAPSSGSWWFPFYVIANHPRIGAAMLAKCGCPERVWRLTELHHLEPHQVGRLRKDNEWIQQALLVLRRADNQN
jgi:putative nucleotidyltransferase with HDIG domain